MRESNSQSYHYIWEYELKHNYTYEKNNIKIRPLEFEDIEKLRIWRNDTSNTTYLRQIPHITKAMQIKWFENYLERVDEMSFAIEEASRFNRMVGSLSLYDIKEDECVFGKILIGDKEARGYNVGRNATEAAVDIAINSLGVSRVILYVYKDNEVACNLYQSVGFEIVDEHTTDFGLIEYTMEYRR